jgi:hypothetical protein
VHVWTVSVLVQSAQSVHTHRSVDYFLLFRVQFAAAVMSQKKHHIFHSGCRQFFMPGMGITLPLRALSSSSFQRPAVALKVLCVTMRRERGKGGKGRRASRKPEGTLTEPTQQHRPTQNTAEADKAVLEHTPTETEKSNNHTR